MAASTFMQNDQGLNSLTLVKSVVNVAPSQTDSPIVAAIVGKKIRVLAALLVAGATATNVTFTSKPSGAGTAISQLLALAANGGAVLPFNPLGWWDTNVGEGLSVTTGTGATVGISVQTAGV